MVDKMINRINSKIEECKRNAAEYRKKIESISDENEKKVIRQNIENLEKEISELEAEKQSISRSIIFDSETNDTEKNDNKEIMYNNNGNDSFNKEEKIHSRKGKKPIVIVVIILVILAILAGALFIIKPFSEETLLPKDFSYDNSQYFDVHTLFCYVPNDWSIETKHKNGNNDVIEVTAYRGSHYEHDALFKVKYYGEFKDGDELLKEVEKDNSHFSNTDYYTAEVSGCDEVYVCDYYNDANQFKGHMFIVLCDGSGFTITGEADESIYDQDAIDELVCMCQFDQYVEEKK